MENKKYIIGNKDLMKEWLWENNKDFNPETLTCGSGKKVWWMCSKCGHKWEAAIEKRNKGRGCPICSKSKQKETLLKNLIAKNGSLFDNNKQLCDDWHPTKNGKLTPKDVMYGSGDIVWWRCKNGHEWQSSINARTSNNSGCPYCTHQKVIIGENDLATTNPILVEEWHPTKNGNLTPKDVMSGSNQKVWWICKKGHEWYASISHRKTTGCPECQKEISTSFPEQAIYFYLKKIFKNVENRYLFNGNVEIDIFLKDYNIGIEYDGSRFHNNEKSLKREQKKYSVLKDNDIFLIRVRESNDESYNINTADYYIGYDDNKNNRNLNNILNDLFKFLSKKLNINIQLNVDYEKDRNLIYAQYLELEKSNSIANLYPELIKEWHPTKNAPLTPYMVTKGSEKRVWWKCSICNNDWEASVNNRIKTGCPYCSGNKLLVGYNDLATRYPLLKKEWIIEKNNNINPSNIIGGREKVWWKCSVCKYEWQATIDSRKRGSGCPNCAIKRTTNNRIITLINKNGSAYDKAPYLEKEFNKMKNKGTTLKDYTSSSNQEVWWKCSICGHEWKKSIYSRIARGTNCLKCFKRISSKKKKVFQFSLDNKFIKEFESVALATKETGAKKITEVCNGNRKQSGGYIWSYEYSEKDD